MLAKMKSWRARLELFVSNRVTRTAFDTGVLLAGVITGETLTTLPFNLTALALLLVSLLIGAGFVSLHFSRLLSLASAQVPMTLWYDRYDYLSSTRRL